MIRKLTEEQLTVMVQKAVEHRDEMTAGFDRMVRHYHGPFYKGSHAAEDGENWSYSPENHAYEYISYMEPILAYQNPKVRVGTRTYGVDGTVEALRWSLNTWSVANELGYKLARAVPDLLMCRCVGYARIDDANDPFLADEGGKRVVYEHVAPTAFFVDRHAKVKEDITLFGHEWSEYQDSLLAMADDDDAWYRDEIESLSEEDEDAGERKVIRLFTVWLKDYELEKGNEFDAPASMGPKEGFHGTIFVFGADGEEETDGGDRSLTLVRRPAAFYGPPDGPYCFQGVHFVPGSTWDLAPLVATEPASRELNRVATTMNESMASYKRLVLVPGDGESKIAQVIADEPHETVIEVPGLLNGQQKVHQVEVGGLTSAMLDAYQIRKQQLDDASGLQEAKRGAVTGKATATENEIADKAAEVRMDWTRQQLARFARSLMRKVGWYHFYDDRIKMVMGPEAAAELGYTDLPKGARVLFEGGLTDEHICFEDTAIEIEPESMGRTNQGRKKQEALLVVQAVSQVAAMRVQFPFLNLEPIIELVGAAYELPNLAELIDEDLANEMVMQQQTAALGVGKGGGQQQGGARQQQPKQTGAGWLQAQQFRGLAPAGLSGNQTGGALAGAQNQGKGYGPQPMPQIGGASA